MRHALALAGLMLAGCAPVQVHPDLERRVPARQPAFRADGSLAFYDLIVDGVTAPAVEVVPHAHVEDLATAELRYRFVLRGPGLELPVICTVDGSHGSLLTSANASITCDTSGYHLVVSGTGSSEFLGLSRVDGSVRGPDRHDDPPPGSPPSIRTAHLAITGSPTVWNLALAFTERRRVDGEWRSNCCERGDVVAAVGLDPPRVHLDPSLEGPLRVEAALAMAALLALRDVRELRPPID